MCQEAPTLLILENPRRMHHSVLTSDSRSASSAVARAGFAPGRQGFKQRRGSASTPSAGAGVLTVPRQRGAPQWHGSISSPLKLPCTTIQPMLELQGLRG